MISSTVLRKHAFERITVVVGLGRSGTSAAKLLKAEGENVILIEKLEEAESIKKQKELKNEGIEVLLGQPLETKTFEPWLKSLEKVVISPSVPWDHPTLNYLRQKGITIEGEMALAWERLKNIPWVGITGTNGKTTVTHLLNHLLITNRINAPMAGNVGNAAAEIALNFRKAKNSLPKWLIMEMSSYQIEAATAISPEIGIWTNLTPDHLERHKSLALYRKIKRGLLEKSKTRIFNADDKDLFDQRSSLPEGIWISAEGPGTSEKPCNYWISKKGMVIEKNLELFDSSIFKMKGKHNLQNLLLVTAAARKIGLSAKNIEQALETFHGVPHRLERLCKIHTMQIYNDSKATNYASASMGIKAIESPCIIIAGGQTKQGDSSEWLKLIKERSIGLILFGSGADELKGLINYSGYKGEIYCCEKLKEAVKIAFSLGITNKAKSLLLSPACASFDQYKDFEERGNEFKTLILESSFDINNI